MSKRIDETLTTPSYDGLIIGDEPVADVLTVTIRKLGAAATLKRGTVLALSAGTAGDGKMVVLGNTAVTNETLTANCVLCDDIDVGTAADVNALAYRSGKFNTGKLVVKSGYTMTAADKEALRDAGILLDTAIDA
jgi:hypothetical protein